MRRYRLKDGGRLGSSHLYIERRADHALKDALQAGRSCVVLGPRQTGKSSMLIRVAREISSPDLKFVHVDLDELFVQPVSEFVSYRQTRLDEREFYRELSMKMIEQLQLGSQFEQRLQDTFAEPASEKSNSIAWARFLRMIIESTSYRVVLTVDELERMLAWSGRDCFFDRLKCIYDSPLGDRLQFCLASAVPIHKLVTCFVQIDQVRLEDFTRVQLNEFLPFLGQVPDELRVPILDQVYDWTGGHPLWTHRICAYLQQPADDEVLCLEQFIRKRLLTYAETPDPVLLEMERNMLALEYKERAMLLELWLKLQRAGKNGLHIQSIRVSENAELIEKLRLFGLSKIDTDRVYVRNRIVSEYFNVDWSEQSVRLKRSASPAPCGGSISSRAELRKELRCKLPDRDQFAAFILDSFPAIYTRGGAMPDRIQLENLLLSTAPLPEIQSALHVWLIPVDAGTALQL